MSEDRAPTDASDPLWRDRTVLVVAGIAAVALVARLVGLGARPFHWDEARLGYWTLRFLETGRYEYRPVAGGPLLHLAGRHVLGTLGATDATARLPVAVVSGLAPLGALLLRERLRDDETVVTAALLAGTPLLLYYGRALRGDVVAATAGFVTVGAGIRVLDGDRRYAALVAVAGPAALAASGFAVAYPIAWLVAGLLLVDHERVLDRPGRDHLGRAGAWLRPEAGTLAGIGAVASLVHLFFFAPRPAGVRRAVEGAFVAAPRRFLGVRVVERQPEGTHQLLPALGGTAETVAVGGGAVAALGIGGFLWDRYRAAGPRAVVAAHGYWGLFGLLLFPVVAESPAPWVAVHAVVPLAVPGGVGGAALLRVAVRAFDAGRTREVAAVCLLVAAGGLQTGAVVGSDVYGPAGESRLATHAQPADDLRPLVADLDAAANEGAEVDVLLYGGDFRLPADGAAEPPVPERWRNRLPLAWYLERTGVRTASVSRLSALADPPPVVIANANHRPDVAAWLDGYDVTTYRLSKRNQEIVVFVRRGGPSAPSASAASNSDEQAEPERSGSRQ